MTVRMAPIMKDIGDTVGQSNEITGCSKTPTIPKAEKTAKSEIWVSTFLVLLFLFHNQALGADTRESLRQRILAGDQVSLRASAPEGARTIEASWIEEAVRRRVPIHISNAVIQGSLELQNSSVEQEFDLQECIFKDYADFSYAIFKRDFWYQKQPLLQAYLFKVQSSSRGRCSNVPASRVAPLTSPMPTSSQNSAPKRPVSVPKAQLRFSFTLDSTLRPISPSQSSTLM